MKLRILAVSVLVPAMALAAAACGGEEPGDVSSQLLAGEQL